MKNKLNSDKMENLVAEEVAAEEVKTFIEYHLDETIEVDQVIKDYKVVVVAVMRGLLDLSDKNAPVLTLREPIMREGGAVDKSKITFLTRIKKSELAALSKGVDINKDPLGFANKMTAFLMQEPVIGMLDKYGKADLKVVDQLTGLFL